MSINCRFALDERRNVIDAVNVANSGEAYCHEGDPEDDEHLRERVLMIHLSNMIDKLIINLNVEETSTMTSIDRSWRTYPRTGLPRDISNLERLARHRAAKLGYRLHRSRRRKDGRGFMLIHKVSSTVLLGAGYTATVESILEFLEHERMQ